MIIRIHLIYYILIFFFVSIFSCFSQKVIKQNKKNCNYTIIEKNDSFDKIIQKAAIVTPSDRQFEWQKMEMTAFLHFTINTFTDKEWGEGTEDISLFNPSELDARQWVKTLKEAGFKMVIITAKHHDGFCLWPSKYTDHSVKFSPWKDGKGDVIKELSEACHEFNLKIGIYLSPWDRHEKSYGDSQKYNIHFCNQLRELLTQYGKIDEVWFDGACGEGPNGKKQVYDWQMFYKTIRENQPDALIAIMGPDIRWVGTESGYGRETEWNILPDLLNPDILKSSGSSDFIIDKAFTPINLMSEDLGSSEKLRNAKTLYWYPAETDVSIRPGWFYHSSEDSLVKSPQKLFDIYCNSVGKNSVLLLNIPPDRRGLINDNDIKSLKGFKKIIDRTFSRNLVKSAKITTVNEDKNNSSNNIIDDNYDTCWMLELKDSINKIVIDFRQSRIFDCISIQENIKIGQRVEKFYIEYFDNNIWNRLTEGSTIGYKRILRFSPIKSSKIRIVIEKARLNPAISEIGVYEIHDN